MIKDRLQKKLAAKFCAAQRIVPYAEVIVRSSASLEDAPVDITDADLLGVEYGHRGVERRILFDCKTGKMSAINRALWVAGLKSYMEADEAYLILKKDAPYSHRLASSSMDVHIHSEANFSKFAGSMSPDFNYDCTYLDDMNVWEAFPDLMNDHPRLRDIIFFSNTVSATEKSGAKGIRSGLSVLLKSSPELDPRKQKHFFLYANFLSAFAGFAAITTVDMRNVFQFDMNKDDFDKTARYYIWGGRDSYQMRRNLKASLEKSGTSEGVSLELPEWAKFVNMFRGFLDAPELLAEIPYLTKEIAFRIMSGHRLETDQRLRELFGRNNRARQFIFSINSYLVAAGRMPKEMQHLYEEAVNAMLSGSPSATPPNVPSHQGQLI